MRHILAREAAGLGSISLWNETGYGQKRNFLNIHLFLLAVSRFNPEK
jgi:hypothetical protein